MVIKLSRMQKEEVTRAWSQGVLVKAKEDGYLQILEDVPYAEGSNRGTVKKFFTERGVKDIRFRNIQREVEPVEEEVKNEVGKCKDCVFWDCVKNRVYLFDMVGNSINTLNEVGECRRHSPIPVNKKLRGGMTGWPLTNKIDYCGDIEYKKEESDLRHMGDMKNE